LVQWNELDLFWRKSFIRERSFDRVKIVRSYRDKRPLPGQILMQFVLQSNERLVSGFGELDVP